MSSRRFYFYANSKSMAIFRKKGSWGKNEKTASWPRICPRNGISKSEWIQPFVVVCEQYKSLSTLFISFFSFVLHPTWHFGMAFSNDTTVSETVTNRNHTTANSALRACLARTWLGQGETGRTNDGSGIRLFYRRSFVSKLVEAMIRKGLPCMLVLC